MAENIDIRSIHTEADYKATPKQISALMESDPDPGMPEGDRLDSILAGAVLRRGGNAALQPREPSARSPLIWKGAEQAPADFGPVAESEAEGKNGQERAKGGRKRARWLTGEVRRFLQKTAQTRGNCRYQTKKSPN